MVLSQGRPTWLLLVPLLLLLLLPRAVWLRFSGFASLHACNTTC